MCSGAPSWRQSAGSRPTSVRSPEQRCTRRAPRPTTPPSRCSWTSSSCLADEVVLVLDDYQAVQNRACHDSLSLFLESAPPTLTVAVSTRADPPIPLGRLRVLDELLELRATHLGFTAVEEAAFVNEALQLELPPESLARLHERTEGWPAGVQLAALSLAGVRRPRRVPRAVRRVEQARRRLPDGGRPRRARPGTPALPARDVHPGLVVRPALRHGHVERRLGRVTPRRPSEPISS